MIEKLYPNRHRFIQDNDPKHTPAWTKQFFIDNGVTWWCTLPGSPDCNPIENLWHELKEHLRREVKPRSKELTQGILSFWEAVDVTKCCHYINHLSKVLPKMIESMYLHLQLCTVFIHFCCVFRENKYKNRGSGQRPH